MKQKLIALLMTLLLVTGLTQVLAVSTGGDIDIIFETEDFAPRAYISADSRLVSDDSTTGLRNTPDAPLDDIRTNNYAFEGEKVAWSVLVYDRNGIDTVLDPVVTVGSTQTTGNGEEALCDVAAVQPGDGDPIPEFNVRDGPDLLDFDIDLMRLYDCELTVESPASMAGQFWVSVEVEDSSGESNIATQNEFWFFNPTIALVLEGDPITFGTVRPGATSYSGTLTIENEAEEGSGVLLEMFLSGSDFTDPGAGPSKCPTTNELELENFRYLAVSGAHSSALENAAGDGDAIDDEGYDDIPNGATITASREIIGGDDYLGDGDLREAGNVLAPGAEVSVTFKLNLPSPCVGDFTDGSLLFWAEAV